MARLNRGGDSSGDDITAETTDRNGARVVLCRRVWEEKILIARPEMKSHLEAVLRSVSSPSHVEADPVASSRTRYYTCRSGPSSWLLAVVSYEQEPARIISAFANRKDSPGWIGCTST